MTALIRKYTKRCVAMVLLTALVAGTGCSPLLGGLTASLASFGAGYWAASRNPTVEVVREYYIDGVKVDDPSALGLP